MNKEKQYEEFKSKLSAVMSKVEGAPIEYMVSKLVGGGFSVEMRVEVSVGGSKSFALAEPEAGKENVLSFRNSYVGLSKLLKRAGLDFDVSDLDAREALHLAYVEVLDELFREERTSAVSQVGAALDMNSFEVSDFRLVI
jgi:hypothetical protein